MTGFVVAGHGFCVVVTELSEGPHGAVHVVITCSVLFRVTQLEPQQEREHDDDHANDHARYDAGHHAFLLVDLGRSGDGAVDSLASFPLFSGWTTVLGFIFPV